MGHVRQGTVVVTVLKQWRRKYFYDTACETASRRSQYYRRLVDAVQVVVANGFDQRQRPRPSLGQPLADVR
jgi:hypothetical protein